MTGNREMYKVFTPFKKMPLSAACVKGLPECVAAPKPRQSATRQASPLPEINYPQAPFDTDLFAADEKNGAGSIARVFVSSRRQITTSSAIFPAIEGTSRLSPCLAVGVLSPRQCLHRLLREQPGALDGEAGASWLNEIIWREFYRHLMVYYPKLCKGRPFVARTDKVARRSNEDELRARQQGQTGFPIVDAAMRQLNATGWMHNRLRMIVASFPGEKTCASTGGTESAIS